MIATALSVERNQIHPETLALLFEQVVGQLQIEQIFYSIQLGHLPLDYLDSEIIVDRLSG